MTITSEEFVSRLAHALRAEAIAVPLPTPDPINARYMRPTAAAPPRIGRRTRLVVTMIAVFSIFSAVVSRSINPVTWATQTAASVAACSRDLSHKAISQCLRDLVTRQNTGSPHSSAIAGKSHPQASASASATAPAFTPTPAPKASVSAPANQPAPSNAAPSPPPATSKPPAALFSDSFEQDALGAFPSGWTATSTGWSVGGSTSDHDLANKAAGENDIYAGSSAWTDYSYSAQLELGGSTSTASLIARFMSKGNYFACVVSPTTVTIDRIKGGIREPIASRTYSAVAVSQTWQSVTMTVSGPSIQCSVDGAAVSMSDSSFPSGGIGISGNNTMSADAIVITAL